MAMVDPGHQRTSGMTLISHADAMKLTIDKLMAGLNSGAINARQLALLGETSPPIRGWRRRLAGKEISEERYMQFLALRKQKSRHPGQQPVPDPSLDVCTIYFDGGTSNNVPSRGALGMATVRTC
jgi:hypothetical protein